MASDHQTAGTAASISKYSYIIQKIKKIYKNKNIRKNRKTKKKKKDDIQISEVKCENGSTVSGGARIYGK